ncbi:MAG: invasion associated locus B family protein [Alphaproteobacteria bacterium]|nr:invasion associated locus B family protein [Alphaproteobacteria bacterium]MCL2505387.1 invasion associated locus B family protein [Alphaproteobacteria bacterium]
MYKHIIICICFSVVFSFAVLRPVSAVSAAKTGGIDNLIPEKQKSSSNTTAPKSAAPGTRNSLGVFSDWQAYYYQENGQLVCYMITSSPKKNNRTSHLMLTHRPTDGELNTFNYNANTALSSKDHAYLSIDGTTFNLFTAKENAWAKDSLVDKKIASFLSSGQKASVQALTIKNSNINDTFSLRGSMAAYEAISKKCQVNAKYAGSKM